MPIKSNWFATMSYIFVRFICMWSLYIIYCICFRKGFSGTIWNRFSECFFGMTFRTILNIINQEWIWKHLKHTSKIHFSLPWVTFWLFKLYVITVYVSEKDHENCRFPCYFGIFFWTNARQGFGSSEHFSHKI